MFQQFHFKPHILVEHTSEFHSHAVTALKVDAVSEAHRFVESLGSFGAGCQVWAAERQSESTIPGRNLKFSTATLEHGDTPRNLLNSFFIGM